MYETYSLATAPIEVDRLQRGQLLNRCLLLTALLLCGIAIAVLVIQHDRAVSNAVVRQILMLFGGAVWIAVAYLLNRYGRLYTAGGVFVALVIAGLALALYLLPNYALLLLPLATLPVALVALLLTRRTVYPVALITILAVVGASWVSRIAALSWPNITHFFVSLVDTLRSGATPPGLPSIPSLSPPPLALGITTATVVILAWILASVRGVASAALGQIQRSEVRWAQAELSRQSAEQSLEMTQGQLHHHQQYLDVLMQHLEEGVIGIDSSNHVVRANNIAQKLWSETTRSTLIGQPMSVVQETFESAANGTSYVEIIHLPTDTTFHTEGYTHVLLDRREHVRVTRLRRELLDLLTDEMRNPLTSMVTALDLTLGQQNLPEDVDRVLIGARKSSQRLLDLVTTLLEMSQIEQNRDSLHLSPVSLCRVLEASIAQVTPLAQQGAITLAVEYSNDCTISMDSERMQRAFVSILEYALRHSPPYSTVQVRVERHNGFAIVRIMDQGPGLSQQGEVLFDPQIGSDNRGTPVLALAFSKLVIEAHDGGLTVESIEGQGSVYALSLPIEERAERNVLLPVPDRNESILSDVEVG